MPLEKLNDTLPPSRFSRLANGLWSAVLMALLIAALILIFNQNSLPYLGYDSNWYVDLASGRPEMVEKPYANRILHPLTVRTLADITNLGIHQCFFIIGLLSLVILAVAVTLIVKSVTGFPWIAGPLLLSPFLMNLFREYYLPDLFHAALLALLFAMMLREKLWFVSLLLLFLLFLTRESTILLSLSAVIVAVLKSKRKIILPVIAITLLGLTLNFYWARSSLPNVHKIPQFLYLIFKVPFNFLYNICGIKLWVNTFRGMEPALKMELPKWLHLGSITTVGIYRWMPVQPLWTLSLFLTLFGIAPTVVIHSYLRMRKKFFQMNSPWMLITTVYGLISFFIAVLLGPSIHRMVGYGWPAFWLAAPVFLVNYYHFERKAVFRLFLLHSAICWVPLAMKPLVSGPLLYFTAVVLSATVLQVFAFREIEKLPLPSH